MGFFPERGLIWLNGELLPWSDARVHVATHALHYGTGIFEGIRWYETPRGPAVFRLPEHLQRFARSGTYYRMTLPFSEAELAEAVRRVVEASGLSEGYIRPLAWYGYGNLGILPKDCPVSVAVMVYPFPMYLGKDGIENGIRVTVSPWRKTHFSSIPSEAKGSGQYLNSFLALSDARTRGFTEALLLNQEGFVAEGSGENFFYVKDGRLITNDAGASILPGITRDSVIEIASAIGVETRVVREIPLEAVFSADEAFFTGTAAEVTPIKEVDGRPIGGGLVGPVTRGVQERYFAAVRGNAPEWSGWLTFLDEERKTGADGRIPAGSRSTEAGTAGTPEKAGKAAKTGKAVAGR
jgi:branched-chain amino acid aminotransferase